MTSRLLGRLVPRTLRGRLALVAVAAATLLLSTLIVVFNAVVARHLRAQAQDRLHSTLAAVAATVDVSEHRVRVRESAHDEALDANVWIYAGSRAVEQPTAARHNHRLTEAARRLARDGGSACATVGSSDESPGWRLCADGPGVPESFVPRLFQPGRRAAPDDGHDGAGLGLPLVLRLTRSVGGTVWHDDTAARGACFVVEVPG